MTNDRKKNSVFAIPGSELFQFTRIPFGLTNDPTTFQRLIDTLFRPEFDPHIFGYLDNIRCFQGDSEFGDGNAAIFLVG